MNVSSIGNSWSIFTNYLKTHQAGTSQASSTAIDLQNLIYSSDGDSLELSEDAQNAVSGFMMYGSPPPPPNGATGAGPGSEIKDFLDKVASGNATTDDLKNMQSVLQKLQQQSGNDGVNNKNTAQNGFDQIKAFLDKVASGTATDEDIQNMQSVLQQAQQTAVKMNPGSFGNDQSDPIKDFLDKVASGTVTDDDLKTMQSVLQQMQQQSGSNGARMHHHQHRSESDGTNLSGTGLDTTNGGISGFDLQSFLDKVASGTVTDDDLKDMQSVLQQMQQQFYNGFENGLNSGLLDMS